MEINLLKTTEDKVAWAVQRARVDLLYSVGVDNQLDNRRKTILLLEMVRTPKPRALVRTIKLEPNHVSYNENWASLWPREVIHHELSHAIYICKEALSYAPTR